jgi:hypothetical protein
MLKTTSTLLDMSARGKSGVASSGTTVWPWLSMARVMASMVSGGSYSASRSSPSDDSMRLRLCARPTLSDVRRDFGRGLVASSGVSRPVRAAAARAVDAVAGEDLLGEPLVERDAERVRVAAGGRDAELFEERRVEPAAHLAAVPLGGVEDDVGREGLEASDEQRRRTRHVDALDVVPRLFERARDARQRLGRVELGVFFAVAEPEVVRESDAHADSPRRPNLSHRTGAKARDIFLPRRFTRCPRAYSSHPRGARVYARRVQRLRFLLRQVVYDLFSELLLHPAIVIPSLALLAIALVTAEARIEAVRQLGQSGWLFGGEPSSVQAVLGTIAGSMMAVLSIVYSVLVMALSLMSMHFSPRTLAGSADLRRGGPLTA